MTESDSIERETVALLNSQALSRLMAIYGLCIPAKDFPNWRPTVRSTGEILGVAQNVTIIATNGLLGYFVNDERETVPVLCGHIQCFTGEVKTLFATQRRKNVEKGENKTRKKRKSQVEIALDTLRDIRKQQQNLLRKFSEQSPLVSQPKLFRD